LFSIDSEHGHDGFLIDSGRFDHRIRTFLATLSQVKAVAKLAENSEEGVQSAAQHLRFAW
jgi:hypothetical protein